MKKSTIKRMLISCMMLIMVLTPVTEASAATRGTDVTKPGTGNTIVSVPGKFEKADVKAILNLINSYRKEACQKGYPNPGNRGGKLTANDYTPIKWSGDLEWISQTRAAEGSVFQDHNRPNGTVCFTCSYRGVQSEGECLAWNYGSLIRGIKQWYEEKDDWVTRNSNAVTGHYTALIDPDNRYVGIGCFTSKSGDWSCVAGAFSSATGLLETPLNLYGSYDQKMEVKTSSISTPAVGGASRVAIGKTAKYTVKQSISYPHIMGGTLRTPIRVQVASWRASNSNATIAGSGQLTAKKLGKITVSAKLANGKIVSKVVNVTEPVKGEAIEVKGSGYKVTKKGSQVAYTGNKNAKGAVKIPATVTYYGKKYKVTSVAKNALKDNKKITSLTIGKNVNKIGANAFYGCNKLKTVTIKSKKLTAGKVGSKAFKGTKKMTVKCPKGKTKIYKNFLIKKGIKKSSKFK